MILAFRRSERCVCQYSLRVTPSALLDCEYLKEKREKIALLKHPTLMNTSKK